MRRLDDFLPMLRVARLFQPYKTDVIQFACLCWLGCGCTARKERRRDQRGGNENQPQYGERFCFHASTLTRRYRCVQDIFTIEPMPVGYRNGIATFAILCCCRRGTTLRARRAATSRGSACALPSNSSLGGGDWLQIVQPVAARRENQRGGETVSGRRATNSPRVE